MHLEPWHNILKTIWYRVFVLIQYSCWYSWYSLFLLAHYVLQIVDKIRVQMDAFLEDGSLEATIAVVRSLVVAVPHTTERLRDYILWLTCENQFLGLDWVVHFDLTIMVAATVHLLCEAIVSLTWFTSFIQDFPTDKHAYFCNWRDASSAES